MVYFLRHLMLLIPQLIRCWYRNWYVADTATDTLLIPQLIRCYSPLFPSRLVRLQARSGRWCPSCSVPYHPRLPRGAYCRHRLCFQLTAGSGLPLLTVPSTRSPPSPPTSRAATTGTSRYWPTDDSTATYVCDTKGDNMEGIQISNICIFKAVLRSCNTERPSYCSPEHSNCQWCPAGWRLTIRQNCGNQRQY